MRFIIMAGPSPTSKQPQEGDFDEKLFDAYMKFNEDMHNAGVLVASEGLNPAGKPARVVNDGGKRKVVDGPYAEIKELLGGFYVIDVKSREEALEWALKVPTGMGFDDVLEIRQLTGEGDLPAELVERIKAVAPNWSAVFSKAS